MRKFVWVLCLIGLVACHSNRNGNALISRNFPTLSWERFDFLEETLDLKKPTSYDLALSATFTPEYRFDYFEIAFTVFDDHDHPLRGKNYKFKVKDRDGVWKSELEEGEYRFTQSSSVNAFFLKQSSPFLS